MYHLETVKMILRGETGLGYDPIAKRLRDMRDGESVAWKRFECLGGGEVQVTRRADLFEVTGNTRI